MAQPMSVEAASGEASKVVQFCDKVIRWTIRALAVLVPFFFLPWTIEVVEINKQLILLVGAGVAGIAWLGKMLAQRKFEYRKSVVNLIVALYLAVYLLSALMSKSRYMSLVGDFGQEKAGLITVAAFVLLYFVVINNIKTAKELGRLFMSIMIGGAVTAIYTLLQGLGLFVLPFAFAKSASFNGLGTVTATSIYLAFIVTLAGGLLMSGHNKVAENKKLTLVYNIFLIATSVISLFVIAMVDYWYVTVCLLVASALLIAFAFVHAKSVKGMGGVLLPISALVVSLLLLVFNLPVKLGFPAEVMPSMKASVDISLKTLREAPFFGSGPGTFIFDYSKYHSSDVNQTVFWNIRFDRASTRFLSLLATAGLLGAISWLAVVLFLLYSVGRKLIKADEEKWHLIIGIFAAWFLLVVAKFLYSSTLALEFFFWLTMALLVIVHRNDWFSVKFEHSPRAAMMLSFVFILSLVAAVSGLVVEIQRYASEVKYASAIRMDQAGGDIDQVVDGLAQAADLNKANDVYLRNLALALLAKANKEASMPVHLVKEEGENDDTFKNREAAAKSDKVQLVASLAANAVNIAKRATDINPSNVAGWSVLGSVYQNLFGVTEGADEWAVKAYEKAIELEPANPALYTELGKVYLYQANVQAQEATKEGADKEEAEKRKNDLLSKAADVLTKASEMKSDYAPAHYQLAIAYDLQGKLKESIAKMERVLLYNNQDVGVGFQLAMLYYRDDRKDDAVKLLEAVVKVAPNYSNARWYLAAMYEEKGDAENLDKAITQVEKVAELNKDNEDIAKKLEDLKAKKANPAAAATAELPAPVEQPVQNPNEPGVKR